MTVPYSPSLISRLLRGMSDAALEGARPHQFQTWPARQIVKAGTIAELITNEKASRRSVR